MENDSIAVLLPCLNEESTIAGVVQHFLAVRSVATIYVHDINSTDQTVPEAGGHAGAIVRKEPLQGKGNVVRSMFADIEADIYVLAGGDETYDVASAPGMVSRLIRNKLDIAVASRLLTETTDWRPAHQFRNRWAWLHGFLATGSRTS